MPQPITATIITLNEEANIEGLIENVKKVCDEVIIVDSESSDRTAELAKKAGAKVYFQSYLGDGPQKNYGVQYAKNDWILSIDADERLGDEAVEKILSLDLDHAPCDGWAVRRKTFVGDKWIKIWYPDWVTRLYNKKVCSYRDIIGHASVVGGRIKKLDCDLLHYSYAGYSDLLNRVDRFASRGAEQVVAGGKKVRSYTPLLHGIGRFFKQYILRGGILEGIDGLNVAVISGFGAYMKYAMAIDIQRGTAKKHPTSRET